MMVSALQRLPPPLLRTRAWLCVALLGVLTWWPALETRPIKSFGLPGQIEHLVAYCATCAALTLAHPRSPRWAVIGGLIAYAAVLEVGQLYVPGRSAQLSDWATGALGAVLGVLAISRLRAQPPSALAQE